MVGAQQAPQHSDGRLKEIHVHVLAKRELLLHPGARLRKLCTLKHSRAYTQVFVQRAGTVCMCVRARELESERVREKERFHNKCLFCFHISKLLDSSHYSFAVQM